jgi:hypothetical protein
VALPPLATPQQLADQLNVTLWTGSELTQVEAFLDGASGELRTLIGQPLSRVVDSTVTLYADGRGAVLLPAFPVVSITSVTVEGTTVTDYKLRDRTLYRMGAGWGDEVVVTYTHGWDPMPADIVKWTCVLAASFLSAAKSSGALGMTAGVTSRDEHIDDYRLAVSGPSGGGAATDVGMVIPDRVAARLKATYGDGGIGWVTYG